MKHFAPQPKIGKRVDDPKYREHVRALPCVICVSFGFQQNSPTEFHHTNCERYSGAKTSCCFGIPLCDCHHKGKRHDRDRTKLAIHNGKESWVAEYGEDTEYTAKTLDTIEHNHGYTPKGLNR